MEENNPISIEQQIINEIKAQNTSALWLASRVNVAKQHLYMVLGMAAEKRKLSDGLKKRIEEVLGKTFTASNQEGQ